MPLIDFPTFALLWPFDRQPRDLRGSFSPLTAANDDFACWEQARFERAVARELSGDLDD